MNRNWWEYPLADFTEEELWEHYSIALRYMDWYYQYADDSISFNRGVRQKHYLLHMKSIMQEIDYDRAIDMYNSARPNGCNA